MNASPRKAVTLVPCSLKVVIEAFVRRLFVKGIKYKPLQFRIKPYCSGLYPLLHLQLGIEFMKCIQIVRVAYK